jgi:2-dehydropantoate 2-reductase
MQFAIIGAGNMGCVYGSNLARIGQSVTLIDVWAEHIQAIRANGLQMSGLNGDFVARVEATTHPSEAHKADVAIILVNAYATQEAAKTARSVLKDSGYVLTLQNGLGNIEILTEVLGRRRVMAGLSFHSGELHAPGQVEHTNYGPTYLGEPDKSVSERLLALEKLLKQANLNPVLEADIMATIWGKFVHNCGINAICAITNLRPGHIREVPELDEFQTRIIEEALALVAAKGITLPDPDPLGTIKAYCAKKFHRVSMLQHLDRGRLTEIDALNGYVVRESEALSLAAPCNDALTRLMKGRQAQLSN